jgi:hypothetical protein
MSQHANLVWTDDVIKKHQLQKDSQEKKEEEKEKYQGQLTLAKWRLWAGRYGEWGNRDLPMWLIIPKEHEALLMFARRWAYWAQQ